MLFPYTYVPHQMDRMQEFIDYIFYNVWCRAPWQKYHIELFDNCPELQSIIEDLHHTEPKGADFFIKGIQEIFNYFKILNTIDLIRLKKWYVANNDLESACNKTGKLSPIKYDYLKKIFNGRYEELTEALKAFFEKLYSKHFLTLKTIADRVGDIDSHYKVFAQQNKLEKCPFCGIADMQGIYHSKREAYDHYLPKALYPFNSINFRNLVPACHHCNSSYKTSKDPAFMPKDPCNTTRRRKVFYPYTLSPQPIEITINLNNSDVDSLKPEEMQISFDSAGYSEEIETWKDIYGVEERYKAKCCSDSDGKYWLEQVIDEWREDGRSPAEFLRTLSRHTQRKPFADNNFLKKAFLEACDQAGVFSKHILPPVPCYPEPQPLAKATT